MNTTNHNIIPSGVLHSEKNNIPKELELGSKGLPVISCDDGECEKHAEIEKEELILTKPVVDKIMIMKKLYESTDSEEVLIRLGKYITNQILYNTKDYSQKLLKL